MPELPEGMLPVEWPAPHPPSEPGSQLIEPQPDERAALRREVTELNLIAERQRVMMADLQDRAARAEAGLQSMQNRMALDLHLRLGLPALFALPYTMHQGYPGWQEWWADLLAKVDGLRQCAGQAETAAEHIADLIEASCPWPAEHGHSDPNPSCDFAAAAHIARTAFTPDTSSVEPGQPETPADGKERVIQSPDVLSRSERRTGVRSELRQRYADALRTAADYAIVGEASAPSKILDALLAVRDDELARARAAIARVHAEHPEYEGRCLRCLEPCTCFDDAEQTGEGLLRALNTCTHGNEPFPCPTICAVEGTPGNVTIGDVVDALQTARDREKPS